MLSDCGLDNVVRSQAGSIAVANLVTTLETVAGVFWSHRDQLETVELNPVAVTVAGDVIALDAVLEVTADLSCTGLVPWPVDRW